MENCEKQCPICYINRKGRANVKGHVGYRRPKARLKGSEMKKPTSSETIDTTDKGVNLDTDGILARRAPALFQYLADDQWEDGTRRETSTLLLFCEDGRLKACLNDRALDRSVFVSGGSLEAILDALELGLSGGGLEWRGRKTSSRKK